MTFGRYVFAFAVMMIALSALCDAAETDYPKSPVPTKEEFEAIEQKANAGDAESQLYIGVFYANGDRVKQDYAEAAKWYRMAAEQGNATAQRNMGLLYDCGIGVERDYAEAVKWYKLAAKNLEPAAFMGLARFAFTYSESVLQRNNGPYNLMRLLACYSADVRLSNSILEHNFWQTYYGLLQYHLDDKKVAEQVIMKATLSDNEAMLRTAIFYFQGQGVLTSKEDFNKWLSLSAQDNSSALFIANKGERPSSQVKLFFPVEDSEKQKKNLETACRSGKEKYFCFWLSYKFSEEGILEPGSLPSGKIIAMAKQGYGMAVDYVYKSDRAKRMNGEKPIISFEEWYEIAKVDSARDDLYSKITLVHFLLNGIGCEQDFDKAYSWIPAIFDDPDARGLSRLGKFLAGQEPNVPPASEAALTYLQEKADADKVEAQVVLALYHGAREEYSSAIAYLKKAADKNNPQAMYFLGRIFATIHTQRIERAGGAGKFYATKESQAPMMLGDDNISTERRIELITKASQLGYLPATLEQLYINGTFAAAYGKTQEDNKKRLRAILACDAWGRVATEGGWTLEFCLYDILFACSKADSLSNDNVQSKQLESPIMDYLPGFNLGFGLL